MPGLRSAGVAKPARAHAASRLCAEIVETDRRYFAMGAQVSRLPGAEIAWVPELAHCPSAVVVQRVSTGVAAPLGRAWLGLVEDELLRLGARSARIYLDRPDPAMAKVLTAAGYEMRREAALVAQARPAAPLVELREVRSDEDWRRKLLFHEAVPDRPDGHGASAPDWVALERAKRAHGLRMFLAWHGGEVVGTLGVIASAGPWRVKNIVVHTDHRRRSVGRGMIAGIAAIAAEGGAEQLCLFGVEGTIGAELYRACGFVETGFQLEWARDLTRSSDR